MAKGWNKDVVEKHTNTKGDLANEGLVLQDYSYETSRSRNELSRLQLYKDATIYFIKNNTDLILPIILKKISSAFNPFPETPKPGFLETGRWFFQLLSSISMIYIFLLSRNKLMKSLAAGLVVSTMAITVLTYSGFRFRVPQAPLELLFIVFSLYDIFLSKKDKKGRVQRSTSEN